MSTDYVRVPSSTGEYILRDVTVIKAPMTSHDSFLAALAEANRVGIPLSGHLPGDVDPREAVRGGVRCIEHLGPGVTVFAAACGCEDEIRSMPLRTIKLPRLKLPGMVEASPTVR
jgi:hypothetical protein